MAVPAEHEADVPLSMTSLQLSENDMLVDNYEQYGNDQPDDVVLVSPPGSASEAEREPDSEPLANDFEAMMAKVLPANPDLETEAETYHTWHIEHWTKLQKKEHGPIFECGGAPWRVLFFPYGNQVEHVSFYLEHGFQEPPPENWYACVQFALVLWNKNDPSIHITHVANHRFTVEEGDWGFTRFCELRKLFQHSFNKRGTPMVENDEACLTAYVRVVKDPTGVLWHSFQNYNSKKETGMVGLRNQGATCYLNSLLQSLYFTNAFRKAVYQIPTEEDANKSNSAWTLQRLFYHLQTSEHPVSTQELTSSFGWESRHTFEQQDVQELSRILMDKLEMKMKGTPAETSLPDLFVGKTKTYISCINVDYESSRIEDFWDIQLNVRGNKTLDDSFKDYIQVETLEGENKYDAGEPYKLQDAKKGVIFESFPPVLHLHLKRFEYDINRDAMMKINDRHEFPEEFDAAPYLSEDADKSEPWIYQLHGVLVHSGDFNAGHYYAFLRPTKDGLFYKFDDDKVIRATEKETLEENYGGEYPNGITGVRQPYMRGLSTKRSMNAYMLVYIRKSRVDDVLIDVVKENIPAHLEKQLTEERTEFLRKKKEREEQHLYMNVGVVDDDTFKHHHGFDLTHPDPNPPQDGATAISFRVLRAKTVGEFAAEVAEGKGLEPAQVRLWVMVNRQNKTTRPDQPLRDPEMSIEEAFSRYGTKGNNFKLYLEVNEGSLDDVSPWPELQQAAANGANGTSLIFLKHFDILGQSLTGVGHVHVKKQAKVSDLAPIILRYMEWPAGTQFMLYEEIKHSMIEAMKPKQTFQQSEIQDGDIICFQRQLPASEWVFPVEIFGQSVSNWTRIPPTILYPDARQYYDYLLNRITIKFAPINPGDSEPFELDLNRKMSYDLWTSKVGQHLNVDPTHMRFAPVVLNTGKPKPFIKRTTTHNLQQILTSQYSSYGYSVHRTDALYYEILDTSLMEYETKRMIKVNWLAEGTVKEQTFDVLVPKAGNVSDLLENFQKRANLDEDTMQHLRVWEVYSGRIYKELDEKFNVAGITDFVSLYIEKIPQEEIEMQEGEFKISCFNFDKEPSKAHGIPFKFVVKPGEIFKETKERLSKRMGVRGKQFEKIKFAVVVRQTYSQPKYLEDDDILADIATEADDQLGLDHVNKNRGGFWKSESFFIK